MPWLCFILSHLQDATVERGKNQERLGKIHGLVCNPTCYTSLVTVLCHERLMEHREAGDDRRDLLLLRKDRAPEVPCARNLSSTEYQMAMLWLRVKTLEGKVDVMYIVQNPESINAFH